MKVEIAAPDADWIREAQGRAGTPPESEPPWKRGDQGKPGLRSPRASGDTEGVTPEQACK